MNRSHSTRSARPYAVLIALLATLATATVAAAPAQAASPAWRATAVTGPTHATYHGHWQSVTVGAEAGTFRLTFEGSSTPDLPFDASAPSVEEALNALPSIGGTGSAVRVAGGPGRGFSPNPYAIEFASGPLSTTELPAITATDGAIPLSNGFDTAVLTAAVVPSATLAVYPTNVGGAATTGTTSVTVGPLPAGVETAGSASGFEWTCSPAGAGQITVTCEHSDSVPASSPTTTVRVPLRIRSAAASVSTVPVSVQGGGAAQAHTYSAKLVVSNIDAEPGLAAFWARAFDADGNPSTQAGGHPHSAGTMFMVKTKMSRLGLVVPVGNLRDVVLDLPPGFLANPLATPRCPLRLSGCEGATRVGGSYAMTRAFGGALDQTVRLSWFSNDVPPNGYPAHFQFAVIDARAHILASLRSDADYGATATSPNIASTYQVLGSYVVLEGSPATAAGKAFLTNPTDCGRTVLPTSMITRSWEPPSLFSTPVVDDSPAVTGCELVPFEPAMSVTPTSTTADSASGLDASIDLPQDGLIDPNAIATSHLKKTVVRLPEGLSVNPSAATSLQGCSDAEVGLKSKVDPSCPDGSKLGTVRVTSPLVDQPLEGVMYLGTPKSTDPQSGQMLRLFLVVRNDRYGLLVKLPGSATADPATGQLTATFDENPRVPFDHLDVKLRGGSRGVLATPQSCGSAPTQTALSPWSGTADVTQSSPFAVAGNCSLGFAPKLAAGMSTSKARSSGSFLFRFSREDGEQWVDGLTAELPKGLLASVKDVPLCGDAQAAAGACPAASRVGSVDASAGSGDPFVLERKGDAFLTEGYKGCPYGLAVRVPVVAGPFDASSPETDLGNIVVRQAVCVDRSTAQVSVVSDPLPTIWHGIPLRVRSVTVNVDRPGFMLNPSDCAQKQVAATFDSSRGATAGASTPFQASGCTALSFRPKLALRLTGRKQTRTGKHPGVRATVTQQGVAEAGIEKTVVRLPKSLALDPDNAQALCEFEAGTKPDLENHCPKGSIVGRARAKTPLLRNDLAGNVYFVKNVRTDPKTGNTIRTLPMLIVALRGEIAVNLKGESSTTKSGRLVNTFASVPDAPISRFNLNVSGGHNGILAVTRTRKATIDLCAAGRHIAEADMDGHNSKRYDRNIRIKTPCGKKATRKAAAKRRAAAKREAVAKRRRG